MEVLVTEGTVVTVSVTVTGPSEDPRKGVTAEETPLVFEEVVRDIPEGVTLDTTVSVVEAPTRDSAGIACPEVTVREEAGC